MKYTVSFNCSPEEEKNIALLKKKALNELRKKGVVVAEGDISAFVFRKKSIDARKRDIKLFLRYDVYTDGDTPENDSETDANFKPCWKKCGECGGNSSGDSDGTSRKGSGVGGECGGEKHVVIIGAGPAGLFATLKLLEDGIKPIIIERGPETSQRKRDIADISRTGVLNGDSNYCFGEGGAGTFSDGKLFSRSGKRGNIGRILQILVFHGADPKILTDAHPHIGTDKLPQIIDNIKKTIVSYGGEVFFNTRCTDMLTDDNLAVTGVKTVNTLTGEERIFYGNSVILACGHSAPDIYEMLASVDKKALEPKTFAVGVRVEHPREIIDKIQYHGKERGEVLPAAEYRLTAQVRERGVYSFCMCPGGLVVPSASSPDGIVVNGMSPSSRNAYWSNAAIVVECRPEDYAAWGKFPGDPLAGLHFRTEIERAAKLCAEKAACGSYVSPAVPDATNVPAATAATDASSPVHSPLATATTAATSAAPVNPQTAPAQLLEDFLAGHRSSALPKSSYTPGLASVCLDEVLPEHVSSRLKEGFAAFNKQMKGFICKEALLIAPETRTSTPVRIVRDTKTLESPVIKGLFPAGEGSGYAGGIVSSAMDGENVAKAINSARQKVKAVVFDMDGVLLDTESMSDRNWYQAADEMGISKKDIAEALEACRGSNSHHIEEELNRRFGTLPGFTGAAFLHRTGELFNELEETEGIPLKKGAAEILAYLKERRYPLALASSTRGETVKRQLKNAGLISYFDALVTGDMVFKSKPDPEIYLTACSKLGVPPEECAGVEDSLNGVRSTAAAGMFAIMVPDKVQPTEEIRKLLYKLCPDLLCLKEFL